MAIPLVTQFENLPPDGSAYLEEYLNGGLVQWPFH
jgi:hypothetical protein